MTERIVSFEDKGLSNVSYLVDCGSGIGIVVDPVRDVAPYLDEARARGLRIAYALETHLHADFISGSRELGVEILAPAEANLAFEHRDVRDGDEIRIGSLVVRVIATPGHTPEHVSYLLSDGAEPVVLFSGGALLPGSVARTDLIAPDQTEPLARALHRSVNATFAALPGDLAVLPTHGGGSFCSTGASGRKETTIGEERRSNPVFVSSEDAFVKELLEGYGSYPRYFTRLREVNRRGATLLSELALPGRLGVGSIKTLVGGGAELIDVRGAAEWAEGHVRNSISIVFRPEFATWLGWVIEPDRPLVFVVDDEQDTDELVRACRSIGYDDVRGFTGIDEWVEPLERVLVLPVEQASGEILDVRQESEYRGGRLPGARNIELGSIPAHPVTGNVSVMCAHGQRSATAASFLRRAGAGVTVLFGGAKDWSRATGRSLETGP